MNKKTSPVAYLETRFPSRRELGETTPAHAGVGRNIKDVMGNRNVKNVVVGLLSQKRGNDLIEYLLVKSRKDFGRYTGYWYPPGGHLEEEEDERAALIREIEEELGLNVKPINKIATTPGDTENQMTHWWECKLLSDKIKINQEEITEIGWFTKDDMENMQLWPATKVFFEEYIFSHED